MITLVMHGELDGERLLAEDGPLVPVPLPVSVALWSLVAVLVLFLAWRVIANVSRRDWGKVLATCASTMTAAIIGSYLSPATWRVDARLAISVWILAAIVVGRGDPTQLAPHSVSLRRDRRPPTDDDMAVAMYVFLGLGLALYFAVSWALALH
jgi:hypothetical protein